MLYRRSFPCSLRERASRILDRWTASLRMHTTRSLTSLEWERQRWNRPQVARAKNTERKNLRCMLSVRNHTSAVGAQKQRGGWRIQPRSTEKKVSVYKRVGKRKGIKTLTGNRRYVCHQIRLRWTNMVFRWLWTLGTMILRNSYTYTCIGLAIKLCIAKISVRFSWLSCGPGNSHSTLLCSQRKVCAHACCAAMVEGVGVDSSSLLLPDIITDANRSRRHLRHDNMFTAKTLIPEERLFWIQIFAIGRQKKAGNALKTEWRTHMHRVSHFHNSCRSC